MRKAVIDVGSNSLLLVVAEAEASGWRYLHESTAITALGDGTKATGLLKPDAIERTLAALREMFRRAHELGAESVTALATMAVRIATNAEDFLAACRAQNTPVTVLSGQDEARLGFLAVANDPLLGQLNQVSIIDPGGHSTELDTRTRPNPEEPWRQLFSHSFPVGALGIRGESTGECVGPEELFRLSAQVDAALGFCYLPGRAGTAVVLGATGTNLISIRERMTHWQPDRVHGQVLTYEEVGRAVGWMMPMTDSARAAIPGMEPGREKTLPFGTLILERFMQAMGIDEVVVSVRGWRHAVIETELER